MTSLNPAENLETHLRQMQQKERAAAVSAAEIAGVLMAQETHVALAVPVNLKTGRVNVPPAEEP